MLAEAKSLAATRKIVKLMEASRERGAEHRREQQRLKLELKNAQQAAGRLQLLVEQISFAADTGLEFTGDVIRKRMENALNADYVEANFFHGPATSGGNEVDNTQATGEA